MRKEDDHRSLQGFNRRTVLQFGVALPLGAASGLRPFDALAEPAAEKVIWPHYALRRDRDELFLKLTAIGFREIRIAGRRYLQPLKEVAERFFAFEFPPQHFAEIAIAIEKEIPRVFTDSALAKIRLTPSAPSELVFRVKSTKPIELRLENVLSWDVFELVLPDLANIGPAYALNVPNSLERPFTRIEMPWGIELSPAKDTQPSAFTFEDPRVTRTTGPWAELWTTALKRKELEYSSSAIPMEVLGVRGFEQKSLEGSAAEGTLTVTYGDRPGMVFPPTPTPIRNDTRIDIAGSLSRRFPYTGSITPLINTGVIRYEASDPTQSGCIAACYEPGRTVAAQQIRLSARGGWLQLEGKWDPFPGCALSGWVHATSLGRDHHVKLVSEGFLYPFGTPCELVILSERAFGLDEQGHFVAPLVQQAFLQLSLPNAVAIEHAESPFTTVSITTPRTPPLDLPPDGDPQTYRRYDFFTPKVGGVPFAFEHVGTDWDGTQHRSAMPMIFVSNKARAPNGLIWEPGSQWQPSNPNLVCPTPAVAAGDPSYMLDQSPGGEGLRAVDKLWALEAGRFAPYGGASMALARSAAQGATVQRVDWIEWARGNLPDLLPSAVSKPFRPRARTMRARIQSIGQLSGEPSSSLVTYRDVRFAHSPILDPEPTTPPQDYFFNVTATSLDPETPYLYMLETRALVQEAGGVQSRPMQQIARDIREAYFGVSVDPSPIPDALFVGIDNEVRFGRSSSSEGVGGLSVPDTHLSYLNRKHGVVGDATFNEGRWKGYAGPAKDRIQAAQRLDFAAFARNSRPHHDVTPFDASREQGMRDAAANMARQFMGITGGGMVALAAGDFSGMAPGLKLGDLFGANAQIIPGLSFSDIFQDVALGSSPRGASEEPAAAPPVWVLRTVGIQWLAEVLDGLSSVSIPQLIAMLLKGAKPAGPSEEPLSLGVEAVLNWQNDVFKNVTVGPVEFLPTPEQTRISISAKARIDLGKASIPANGTGFTFTPGTPKVSARAEMAEFSVKIFNALKINFSIVLFEIFEDGGKDFSVKIRSVDLLPPLDFISQLAKIFGGLGDNGVNVVPTPRSVRVWQNLQFPSEGAGPLFMGPAQILNLAFGWSVTIPLTGRDVLAVGFSVSKREKPLTIYVPPWYGGKAYALIEMTTRGCRLVEVSMEYGALIPIQWGIATGQAALTAGIFYMLERDDPAKSANVILRAFAKAAADLSVAGIIDFAGLIYIGMERATGDKNVLEGTAEVSVSIKIGFVRVSYGFSAAHREVSGGGAGALAAATPLRTDAALTFSSIGGSAPASDGKPFGPAFKNERRLAFQRVLAGYR